MQERLRRKCCVSYLLIVARYISLGGCFDIGAGGPSRDISSRYWYTKTLKPSRKEKENQLAGRRGRRDKVVVVKAEAGHACEPHQWKLGPHVKQNAPFNFIHPFTIMVLNNTTKSTATAGLPIKPTPPRKRGEGAGAVQKTNFCTPEKSEATGSNPGADQIKGVKPSQDNRYAIVELRATSLRGIRVPPGRASGAIMPHHINIDYLCLKRQCQGGGGVGQLEAEKKCHTV
ncbi:hypothetical protein C8R47DRAFT_1079215 [Mycena vitilis]|nr:hypothetical protein C8R47DRAFT_1079215 [Mycena vitilis]